MAPRKPKAPEGPTPVDSIRHGDTRANIPTADAQDFVDPAIENLPPVTYPRDITLDPQLVWKGKDAQDSEDLSVDAPPIYIQEKIDPRVLIENLRRTAEKPEYEPELSLFDTFDGLDELSAVEFYSHEANWSNRMILGDSLQAMASLAEREELRGQVQMVYLDPPYGIKFGSNWQVSARKRDVKDGKLEDAAREAEQIKAFRDTWELGIHSYLAYLRDRLTVARDLLTESGSCFVQIGDENVHLVRSLMDEVFWSENFISQIVFKKTSGATSQFLATTADHLIWFAKDNESLRYRPPLRKRGSIGDSDGAYNLVRLSDGSSRRMTAQEKSGTAKLPSGSQRYRHQILTSPRVRSARTGYFPVEHSGQEYLPSTGEWKTNRDGMNRLKFAERIAQTGNSLSYVRYLDDFPAIEVSNLWDDTQSGSGMDKIYVVQSSNKVIERCMLMCTDPGDLVLDPTCGSGTTAYVAEQWGRRWITMDTSRVALALARQRIMGAKYPYFLLADSTAGRDKEAAVTGQPAAQTATPTNDIRHGFVYERIQHITLKSIANNPDIKEGMSREEIDAAIKRHADIELLYDKPYEDKKRVRVAGPFTVESLTPHRSVSFSGDAPDEQAPSISEAAGTVAPENLDFERSILENLQAAGIQNGKRAERFEFAALEDHAGKFVQAIGEQRSTDADAAPSKVALAIGPQYGTVDGRFIKEAAKEALADPEVDLLCVLAFAFDPLALGVTEDGEVEVSDAGFANVAGERKLGRMPVLLVRMNAELLMGEDLKKTGKGNLFTVFGEPDFEVTETNEGIVVDLRGVDVFDPTTGLVRSNDTGQIALWMIDTDYNGESFFVRHCYFTGGNDPYKRLKTALKADVDPDAWDTLYRTTSRPFPRPGTGRIAVKVINDYGDEVMKVIEFKSSTEEA